MFEFWLFFRRFLTTTLSYKTALWLSVLSLLATFVQFYFMGDYVAMGAPGANIQQFTGNLVGFYVTGVGFSSFIGVALGSFPSTIRLEQQMGTLEFLMATNTSLESILLYAGVINCLFSLVQIGLVGLLVTWVFGVPMQINLISTAAVLVLTFLIVSGIGFMSAGVVLVTKVGDPISWVFTTLSALLSGTFFPVSILPPWMQALSALLPTTYALRALRKAMLARAGLREMSSDCLILVGMALVCVTLGLLVARMGYNQARRHGTLTQY